jgi:trans-2,3-dihydro-3-hydroxyanthranilate isomerase
VSSLPYEIVDVFTDRPYTGNPLAVVYDADHLAAEQMQAMAREFNLSETVFVLPPSTAGASYRARIFTPTEELPFAGHPTVGTAVAFASRSGLDSGTVVQECGIGLLSIQVYPDGKATLTGGPPTVGPPLDTTDLLRVVGLEAEDLTGPAPRMAGCGLEFPYLSVRPDAVARAQGDPTAARATGITQVDVFAWDPANATAHVRVFVPGLGVLEDPATGSAALGLGVFLVASGLLPGDGEADYRIEQGREIHRPSILDCRVTAEGGLATQVTVTGHVVKVARGQIAEPPFVG